MSLSASAGRCMSQTGGCATQGRSSVYDQCLLKRVLFLYTIIKFESTL